MSECNSRTQDAVVMCNSFVYGLVLVWYIHFSVKQKIQVGLHAAFRFVAQSAVIMFTDNAAGVGCKCNSLVFGLALANNTTQDKHGALKLNVCNSTVTCSAVALLVSKYVSNLY